MPNRYLDDLGRSFGETLDTIGSALNAPGDYYRGAVAGKPGARMSGQEYLQALGAPISSEASANPFATFAVESATDPLLLAGAAAKGVGSLARSAESPINAAIKRFMADESGTLDWTKLSSAIRDPVKRALLRSAGPEEYFAKQGVNYADVPARRLELVGQRIGVPVEWKGSGDTGTAFASYNPGTMRVELPRNKLWTDPARMTDEMLGLGTGPAPFSSTFDPRHLGAHEMTHALQHREAPDLITYLRSSGGVINPERSGWLGRNVSQLARMNPHEAVAEIGAKKVLTPDSIIKPQVEQAWGEYGGPNLDELIKAFNMR